MINIIRRLFGMCAHDWEKWSVRSTSNTVHYNRPTVNQQRICKKCGQIQLRVEVG